MVTGVVRVDVLLLVLSGWILVLSEWRNCYWVWMRGYWCCQGGCVVTGVVRVNAVRVDVWLLVCQGGCVVLVLSGWMCGYWC